MSKKFESVLPAEKENFKEKAEKKPEIMVAVSELKGDNILDEKVIKSADLIELKFYEPDTIQKSRGKERLVHILAWYKAGEPENKIDLDLADDKLPEKIKKLGLPQAVEAVNPKWLSLHFGWPEDPMRLSSEEIERFKNPKTIDEEKIFEVVCRNVQELKNIFKDRTILLENLDWLPHGKHGGALRLMVNPEFISRVLEKTDVGFLLDLQHAYVSARNLGLKFSDYLSCLPLERVKEIHLSRPTSLKRSSLLMQEGKRPAEKDFSSDVFVDIHKALVTVDNKHFSERVRVILEHFWKRMPNLEVITLELNLSSKELVKNIEIVKGLIQKIKTRKGE